MIKSYEMQQSVNNEMTGMIGNRLALGFSFLANRLYCQHDVAQEMRRLRPACAIGKSKNICRLVLPTIVAIELPDKSGIGKYNRDFIVVGHRAGTSGDRELLPRAPHAFRTLRSPGADFTFAITGDSHAWSVYSQDTCIGSAFPSPTSWKILRESLKSLRDDPEARREMTCLPPSLEARRYFAPPPAKGEDPSD